MFQFFIFRENKFEHVKPKAGAEIDSAEPTGIIKSKNLYPVYASVSGDLKKNYFVLVQTNVNN